MKFKAIDIKKPEYVAVIAAFVFGLFVHLFGLVNILHNNDDIFTQPIGYGCGLTSGRWFLAILGKIVLYTFSGYNLPWFNGVFFILLIGIAAGFLVSVFEVRSRKSAILIGMAMVSFPSATATLFFKYTVIYYGIAIIMSVLAAWVISRWKYGFFISAIFTTLSLGIYQAYLPLTVSIFLILLLKQTLKGETSLSKLILRGVYYCGSIILGLIIYFVVLHLLLNILDKSLDTYQGISSMGSLTLDSIPGLIRRTWTSFWLMPIKNTYQLAQIPVLKLAYVLLLIGTFALVGSLVRSRHLTVPLALFAAVLCMLYPIAINLIVVMCPDSYIYALMVYAFALILCTPLVLLELIPVSASTRKPYAHRFIVLTLSVIIFCNAYLANVSYSATYYSNRQAENYLNSMVTQVRMTSGFNTSKKWAFIGKIDDPLLQNVWQKVPTYGGTIPSNRLLVQHSWLAWIEHYFGYTFETATEEELELLTSRKDVQDMPCWPNEGSVKVIDDMVVIKFQNS